MVDDPSYEYSVAPNASVLQVAKLMEWFRASEFFIVEHNKPLGVVRHSDIVYKVVAKGLDPAKIAANQIMHAPPPCVRRNTGLREIAKLMIDADVSRVLMFGEEGIIGCVTAGELLGVLTDKRPNDDVYRALAARVRLQILELLSVRQWSVEELAKELGLSPVAVRHHMEVLEHAGMINVSGQQPGRIGRPSTLYSLGKTILRRRILPNSYTTRDRMIST